MNPFLNYWLIALTLVGASTFILSGKGKDYARTAFIVLASFFVLNTLSYEIVSQSRLSKVAPILEADRAELMLRFNMSMKVVQEKLFKGVVSQSPAGQIFSSRQAPALKQKDFNEEALRILSTALKQAPDSHLLQERLAVVLAEGESDADKQKAREMAQALASAKEPVTSKLGQALATIYGTEAIPQNKLSEISQTVRGSFAPGWFRDVTMLHLFRRAGANGDIAKLSDQIDEKSIHLFINSIIAFLAIAGCTLVGVILLLIQLGAVSRKGDTALELKIKSDTRRNWSFKVVYAVFILWLTTQIIAGTYVQNLLKPFNLRASDVIGIALATAVIYLCENGPGLIYIFWLALRPAGIGFLEGVCLKPAPKHPFKLVVAGISAWCTAIPLVMVAFLISASLFGSQGSSNPIIALILEASRASNHFGSAMFYVTLGVLAPLCEEPLFRGFLYTSLRRRFGIGVSLVASALLFSVLHLDPGGMLPLFALGLVFGYAFERSGSLVPAVVAHGLWNAGSFTLLLLLFSW